MLARRVHAENRNLRRLKGAPEGVDLRVFSLHAPEVECTGKGKAHRPYEFGVKVSVATTLSQPNPTIAWARNHLAGQAGDAINAILAAVGYNFRRLLAWFRLLLSAIWLALTAQSCSKLGHEIA